VASVVVATVEEAVAVLAAASMMTVLVLVGFYTGSRRWRSIAARERPNRWRLCSRISSEVPSGPYSLSSTVIRSRPMPRRSQAVNGSWSASAPASMGRNSGASNSASRLPTRNAISVPAFPITAVRTALRELVRVLICQCDSASTFNGLEKYQAPLQGLVVFPEKFADLHDGRAPSTFPPIQV